MDKRRNVILLIRRRAPHCLWQQSKVRLCPRLMLVSPRCTSVAFAVVRPTVRYWHISVSFDGFFFYCFCCDINLTKSPPVINLILKKRIPSISNISVIRDLYPAYPPGSTKTEILSSLKISIDSLWISELKLWDSSSHLGTLCDSPRTLEKHLVCRSAQLSSTVMCRLNKILTFCSLQNQSKI